MKTILFILFSLSCFQIPAWNDNPYLPIKQTKDPVFKKGEKLYIRDCKACHYIGMDKVSTAPALGGITKVREKKWLYRYTRNSPYMHKVGDSIADKLSKEGWGLMPAFPKLTNTDIDAIYYFVEKKYEMTKNGIPAE
jgi:mono/diheme cytochrome c family protein